MIHIRIDNERENSKQRMACGVGPKLPSGDKYFFDGEPFYRLDYRVDCPKCRVACGMSDEPRQIGTPLSQLSGRPGEPGYAEFCRIARSWGHD